MEKINSMQKKILKSVTQNIGRIEIKNGEIYCYVDAEKLSAIAFQNNKNFCLISVNGITEDQYDRKTLIECNLDDVMINYIFSNMHFHNKLYISSDGVTSLIFDKCTFTDGIHIEKAIDVQFIKCEYNIDHRFTNDGIERNEFLISSENKNDVKCITFDGGKIFPNSGIMRINDSDKPLKIAIDMNAEYISFENIELFNMSSLRINCDCFDACNCRIDGKKIEIIADDIVTTSSNNANVILSDTIVIDTKCKNYDITSYMFYNSMLFNGVQFENSATIASEEEFELQKNRMILANTLRSVYDKCQNNINNDLIKIQNGMKKQSIKRLLKK